MFPQGFSARSVEPAGTSSQLPISPSEGHTVIINGAEMVAVKDKPNDGMLVLNLRIVEGNFAGIEGPYRLNLFSSSEQAAKIASQQLSALCWVTGKPDAHREEELFNIPFKVIVVPQTGEGKENYTQVKGVLSANGQKPSELASGKAPAQQPSAPPQMPVAPPPVQAQPEPQAPPANVPWGQPAAPTPPEGNPAPAWAQNPAPSAAPPWSQK